MKKIMAAMLMVLALVGCGGGDPEPDSCSTFADSGSTREQHAMRQRCPS